MGVLMLSMVAVAPPAAAGPPALLDCDDATGPTETEVNPAFAGAASTETYTCKLTDSAGQPVSGLIVDGEVIDVVNDPDSPDGQARGQEIAIGGRDYRCTTNSAGTCALSVSQVEGEVGTTRICFYQGDDAQSIPGCSNEPWDEAISADGTDVPNDMVDTTLLTWDAGGPVASRLDTEADSTASAVPDTHTVTAKVYDQFGNPFEGNTIVKLVFMQGSPSFTHNADVKTCSTGGTSTCSYSWSQSANGTDYLCTYLGSLTYRRTTFPVECEDDRLHDPDDDPGTFDTPSVADRIDVVRVLWGDAGRLDCDDPSGDTEQETRYERNGAASTVVYTCRATDGYQEVLSPGTVVYGEATAKTGESPNDPDDGTSFASPDFSCTLGAAATCQVPIAQTDLETGTLEICFYLYVNTAATRCTEQFDNDEFAISNSADAVRAGWIKRSAQGSIVVTPPAAVREAGSKHVLTVTVYDKNGSPLADDTNVRFELYAGSPGDSDGTTFTTPDRTCRTTWSSASCSVAFRSIAAGRDVICVWINHTPVLGPDGTTCKSGGFPDNETLQDQKMAQVTWAKAKNSREGS